MTSSRTTSLKRSPPASKPSVTLTKAELREAWEYADLSEEDDHQLTISYFDETVAEDTGELMPAGHYIFETEYPEEGRIFLGSK